MKFLHAADIHLDSPLRGLERYEGAPVELIRAATRRALENLVELAIREKVDAVVIAGDLYDGDWRDFNTGMFFVRQMSKLHDAGIRVYLIAGNHDAASTMTRKLRLPTNPEGDTMMLSHERAETRRLDDLGFAIHGRSFANQSEQSNLVPDYPKPIPHLFNLGMLHTSLNGSEEHDTYAPCTPAELRAKGYQYWALGHIHKRSVLTDLGNGHAPILYSGNVQGRHIREAGDRGCLIVTTNDRHETEITFHPLDVFRWQMCGVSCADITTVDECLECCERSIRTLVRENPKLPLGVRLSLEGSTKLHQQLTSQRDSLIAEIRSMATVVSDGRVWVEQVRQNTRYQHDPQLSASGDGPLGELVNYLDELSGSEEGLKSLSEELKDLAKKLPPEILQSPDGVPIQDTQWLRDFVQQIKPVLLDRLTK